MELLVIIVVAIVGVSIMVKLGKNVLVVRGMVRRL